MSKVFLDLSEPLKALHEAEQARELFVSTKTPALQAAAETNIALCHLGTGNIAEGLALLKRLEEGKVANRDTLFRITLLFNICYAYSQSGVACPETYIRSMSILASLSGNDYFINLCNINISSWLCRNKRYNEARTLLLSTLAYASKHGLSAWKVKCYLGLADCDMAKHDYVRASYYYSSYVGMTDSIEAADMHTRIMKAEEAERIRQFDMAIYAEKKNAWVRYVIILAASVLALSVLVAVILVLWYKHKNTSIRLMDEQVENEQKRIELEAKNRRIAAATIEMEDKNNTLKAISSMIDSAKDHNEIGPAVAGRIKAQVKIHLDSDAGWDTFKETFEKVYPHFFEHIKQCHPELTEYDVRLCTYIMAGADNKQIAMLLNILPESLKKSRTRLRKKLKLATGVNLAEYLHTFNY